VPVPETLLAYGLESTVKAASLLGYPVVVKPVQGSWGRLLALARDEEELRAIVEHREYMGALYRVQYVQEYVRKPGRDIRATCIGDSVPAAIYRVSGSWITNTARGGRAEPARVTPEMEDLTLRACKALGVEVGGVDIVEHPEKGLLVLEVNAVPEYKNVMRVTGVDVAREIAEYLYGEAKR
jgi:[lysine-biosynthesis-protein LysW]--L-2-aminoadipate ligase